MEGDFTAQAQRFGEWCFWGVGCGCDIGIRVSGCCSVAPKCFRDKSQLGFWWMGVSSERVEIIPNVWRGESFVDAHTI